MKLKASEAVFILICLCAAIIAVMSVYVIRERSAVSELNVNYADSAEKDEYDIAVINSASLEDFMKVSGIGEVKAGDIIAYRTAIGGFRSVVQLKDVNGISDALYQRIIEYFYTADMDKEAQVTTAPQGAAEESEDESTQTSQETAAVTQAPSSKTESETKRTETTSIPGTDPTVTEKVMRAVDINSANAEEISDALMIDIELAREIVALRDKIQYFSTVQELDLCSGMTNEIYRRIKDYVLIG